MLPSDAGAVHSLFLCFSQSNAVGNIVSVGWNMDTPTSFMIRKVNIIIINRSSDSWQTWALFTFILFQVLFVGWDFYLVCCYIMSRTVVGFRIVIMKFLSIMMNVSFLKMWGVCRNSGDGKHKIHIWERWHVYLVREKKVRKWFLTKLKQILCLVTVLDFVGADLLI